MLTFLIIVVICGVIGALVEADPWYGTITAVAPGVMVAVIACMIIGGIAYEGTHKQMTSHVQLQSIADGSGVHGQFFLGSGVIDSTLEYTWYEMNGNNSYVRKSVDASMATIHYLTGKETTPYYTTTGNFPNDHGWLQAWGINFERHYSDEDTYDFYIPKGSITHEYILDNKG